MGKTLQKQKKKAQLGAQHAPQKQPAGRQDSDKKSKRKQPKPVSATLTNKVSSAFSARDWDGAVQALEAMRRAGVVPKLGAVQRWVRLADMVGEPAHMARLLSAILRAVPGGGPIAHADGDALRACVREANGIRFYPNWTPPMSPHQQLWAQAKQASVAESVQPLPTSSQTAQPQAQAPPPPSHSQPPQPQSGTCALPPEVGSSKPGTEPAACQLHRMPSAVAAKAVQAGPPAEPSSSVPPAAPAAAQPAESESAQAGPPAEPSSSVPPAASAAQPAEPGSNQAWPSAAQAAPRSTSAAPRFSLVEQDESMQPAKIRPGFKELKIYALEPHTIRFGPDPVAARHDVPFVPGAFVLSGLLSPDECRQLIEASEAIGYSWDVDYTFNPSSPADSASLDPEQELQNNCGQESHQGGVREEELEQDAQQGTQQQPPHQQEQQYSKQQKQPYQEQRHSGCDQGVSREQEQTEDNLAPHEECLNSGPCQPSMGSGPGHPSKKQRGEQEHQGTQQQPQEQQQKGEQKKAGKKQKGQRAQAQRQQESPQQPPQQKQQPEQKLAEQDKRQDAQPRQHPLLSAARTAAGGDRAAGCVLLGDDSIMGPLVRRMSVLMPQVLCGGKLAGLNCRLRLYRYDSGNVYRPHVDGSWPGSGIKNGKMVHDAYGDRWSRLTFLIYLNDDFEGGATTFFTPAPDNASLLQARGVVPRTGNVLCFAHGDTQNSLVHEGSAVTAGKKYVIRTDVLYTLSPSS